MHRVNLLRHFGVKPILVFDGGLLPMKSEQENKRARYPICLCNIILLQFLFLVDFLLFILGQKQTYSYVL